ncbi:MAG: hypothetical protein UV40_C0024G0009 [Parcubacteria group bacterium GW2011_GWA1_42_7]|nr:MAG: hypothetical protein UV34_C0025G0010 [Parcubacteria group bacterium GW2011_GWB1_42_6]KKS69407.1 MAG: hypothetical protein UV40_C0024G0009 [Parcubacteria group bacterium GW2011_GWA1_42_7]KKS91986.1 MAG: hypothetical protein UV67_C0013G0011 [Parcubacteria group bacterium GW2011_GWC1_43_12]
MNSAMLRASRKWPNISRAKADIQCQRFSDIECLLGFNMVLLKGGAYDSGRL